MTRLHGLNPLHQKKNDEEYQQVGKLVLFKNALSFNHAVFQVSNICSLRTTDHSHDIHHQLPTWVVPCGLIGMLLAVGGMWSTELLLILPGFVLLALAARAWLKFIPTTAVSQYGLTIELASGKNSSFMSSDRGFIEEAARIVSQAIASKSELLQRVEMNFDNRTITIENATNSNIVGGDVLNSHLEA